jgi:hypothetical protein
MTYYSWEDYIDNPFLSTKFIGSLLQRGALTLFVGAGVSQGFGLPNWKGLKTIICETDSASDEELDNLIDDKDDGSSSYIDSIHAALYGKISIDKEDYFTKSPLLLAIAALSTGTCRGRIDTIITYNYDDLLKQYLEMLGYKVCVRKKPSDLSSWADVEMNHVHGFLPQDRKDESPPNDIIFSRKSYRNKRARIDSGWSSYVEQCLSRKIGLFLGLSGNDETILDILQRLKNNNKREKEADDYPSNQVYTGYWLLTEEAYKANCDSIVDVSMCPIKLSLEDFPKFILEVCRCAAP